ncbi:MAG: hypothetical protein HOP09_15755 [Hyphomicrobium sp.]|nr:hypothetical protein [Hyphomicrobium sp.]
MTNSASNSANPAGCCSGGPTMANAGAATGGMTLGGLMEALGGTRGSDLAFVYGDRVTKPGYHITEFKFARVTGLDCGANVESWTETVLQLWDIEESVTGEHMTVNKLLGIGRKAITAVGAEPSSRVVFEVSDGCDAMRIFAFDRLEIADGLALIHLKVEVSACKPLVRGILNVPGSCGPKPANPAVQGSGPVSRPAATKCCG